MAFDVKAAEAEAKKELAEQQGKAAKAKIKVKLEQISGLEKALANARREYACLLEDIGSE
jgi:hypothetical protein